MKRILLLLFIGFSLCAKSQVYNNEWIDYSKTYYKFKVGATKLYRISQPTLASIGLGSTPAEHFQLWRHGQQVPIYTSVQTGIMQGSDYIEFWGEMNDGKADNILYRLPDYQVSDKWSLETDTSAYFLTVNPIAANNARLEPTTNDVAGNTLAPETYFMHTIGKYYQDKINSGRSELVGDSYTFSSSYDYGEGWTSSDIPNGGGAFPFNSSGMRVYTGADAPAPVIKVSAAGNGVHAREIQVKVNGSVVHTQPLNYYDYAKISTPIPNALISTSSVNIEVNNIGVEPNDRMVVGQIELEYPHSFDMGSVSNMAFELPANSAGNYLEITGFFYTGSAPVLYDYTNGKRYVADITNPVILRFALQPSAYTRKMVLVSQGAVNITPITSFQQRNFVDYGLLANQGNFLIITNPVLTTGPNGSNPINDYKDYRSSAAGGGYNAKVYMIEELVDQFGWGIKKHPLSIRNFLRWARATYASPLKNVLIIGKGVVYNQSRPAENNPDMEKLNLVPSFGYPASDNMLSAEPGSSRPLTPIGRISVINGEEVATYLNKLKQYEQAQAVSSPYIADKAWMKNVVHVTGASDDNTNAILETALNGHSLIITDTFFGGKVHLFTKNSADAVQQLSSERLTTLMNNGIGMLTYFGHSSATTLEFNLDNPANYNNAGKYPVFVVMGCNAGNFFNFNVARFSTKETLSERYVLAPERGSVAFLASTHLGIVHYLDIYNTQFYSAVSRSHYGGTIGEQMNYTIEQVFNITTENDFYARFQCEQFSLHGDPALKIYAFEKPDYVIEDPLVKVSPSFISVGDREFLVKASFMNIGKSPADSIVVECRRTFPNGSTVVFQRDTIRGVQYMDSITYVVDIQGFRDKGLNKISICLDPENNVTELYENNNCVTKDVYIYEDEARPIFPYNYSIVNEQNPKLVVSSANAFAQARDYVMEIDTTELFNSPLKVTRTVNSAGGVFEFTPGMTFTDSTVYYWRVAPAVPSGTMVWNKSSFIYIAGSEAGFNQSHLYQHFKSDLDRIKLDSASRKWEFGDRGNNVFVRNGIYPNTSGQGSFYSGTINDVEGFIGPGCSYNELIFNIIDPISFKAWKNEPMGLYGSNPFNCGAFPGREYGFRFLMGDTNFRHRAMNFIDNIPDDYIVVIRNNGSPTNGADTYPSVWKTDETYWGAGNSLYHRLVNQGFANIDSFNRARSWIFIFKKNRQNKFTPQSVFSQGIADAITINANITSPDTLGYITSPLFGPAKGWKEVKWRGSTLDAVPGDVPMVTVIGVNNSGAETELFGLDATMQDFDISSIDPVQFPYVKLKMRNVDSVKLTPYQLKYWRLTYDPVPEGAIAPNLYFTAKDQTEVGEPAYFGVAFKNISKVDFDSVLVKFSITDAHNVAHDSLYRMKKLVPGDTVHLYVPIDTRTIAGNNTLFVNFNPDNDQPEHHLFNNFAFKNLYVKPDSLHPLLDVTFDGVHILNRDIVSSKPDIVVKLKDEAKWAVLDDTTLMTLTVRYPDGTMRRFAFDNDTLRFTPAGTPPVTENTATINFKPYFLQDGDYELIVSGKDRSNNSAGNIEYRVAFQVINKPMISNMLNYPNPFTTSTAFVFTLTGSEIPQNIRIQVMTITGKIVREITKAELGTLRIGRNITEFKWDGTDQYGQKLANGIYLYRVITNQHGKSLEKYKAQDDETDKYFNKGYGKMYLMR